MVQKPHFYLWVAGKVSGLTDCVFTGLCGALPETKGKGGVVQVVYNKANSRMGKVTIFLFAVFFLVLSGVLVSRATAPTVDGVMTMITDATELSFILEGTGTAMVDWGDGSETQTKKLTEGKSDTLRRSFADSSPRTITITGKNITGFNCERSRLTALDVSRNGTLKSLDCDWNWLDKLDVSKNIALVELSCALNHLKTLDVSQNTALERLNTSNNYLLRVLDVSRNTALKELVCSGHRLTKLDVSKNTALTSLYCENNRFTADALNALFLTLHENVFEKSIEFAVNPGSDDCDPSIAERKGWTVNVLPLITAEEIARLAPVIKKWTDFYNIDFTRARLLRIDTTCFNCPPDSASLYYVPWGDDEFDKNIMGVDYSPDKSRYVSLGILFEEDNGKYYFVGWDDSQSVYLADSRKKHMKMIMWNGVGARSEAVFWISNDVFVLMSYDYLYRPMIERTVRVYNIAEQTTTTYQFMRMEGDHIYGYLSVYLKEKGIFSENDAEYKEFMDRKINR